MSIEIPNSAVAVVGVDLSAPSASFGATADSVLNSIQQELQFDGLTVAKKDVGFSGISFPFTGEFTATLQILNQSGQELDDTDLTSQFTDACRSVGVNVNAFGIQQVITPPSGQNSANSSHGNVIVTGAGTETASTATQHICGDPSWSFFDDPAQWFQCLTSKGLMSIGLIAIGLLIGVVLIVSGAPGAAVAAARRSANQ